MRYLISIVALLFAVSTAVAQSDSLEVALAEPTVEVIDNVALWESGNQAYIDGDYAQAVACYSAIENGGNIFVAIEPIQRPTHIKGCIERQINAGKVMDIEVEIFADKAHIVHIALV